ncbi:MAG TPA: hypothetical protein VGS19_18915 [Streptosporangiaceae bacterium]|nr:hypothetical protein [Streptosporangiaceae bacterium]
MWSKIFAVLGGLLVVLGIVWILQGLNLLGQTGGMNGQRVWAVIGAVGALVGLGLILSAARTTGRARRTPPAPR